MTDRRTELRKVARTMARDSQRLSALARTPQLADSSVEDGSVDVYDAEGNLAAVIGKQWDGAQGVAVMTGPTPPTPTAPILGVGPGSLTVRWDGVFGDVDGVPDITIISPMDFSRVEVHVSDDPDLIADEADTLKGTIESPRGGEITVSGLEPGVEYFARLVARSTPGKAGAASPVASATPALVELDDGIAPPSPSTPVVTASRGVFSVSWDGLGSEGDAMPSDFRHVVVLHATSLAGPWDEAATLTGKGSATVAGLPYGTHYFALYAIDRWGWASDASPSASATSTPLVEEPDIADAIAASASGKLKIAYGMATPVAPEGGWAVDDVWYQTTTDDVSSPVVAWHRWDGDEWVLQPIAESFLPLVNIGTGTYGSLDGGRLTALSVDTPQLAANAVEADNIAAGAVKAAHLDVVAGDPNGARMELKPEGMKLYGEDGSEVVNLSATPPHYLGITDGAGDTLAALSSDGTVSGQGLNIASDPILQGFPLFGWTNSDSFPQTSAEGFFDYLPRGIVARGYRSMASASVATNQEREILELSYMRYARRAYKITVSPVAGYINTGYGYLKVYMTSDGSRPTMNDANLLQVKTVRNGTGQGGLMLDMGTTWYDLADDGRNAVRRYLFTYEALNGNVTWFGNARDGSQFRVWVEDMGLDIPETGIDRNGVRANAGSTPTVVEAPEVQNYTKTYTATGYRSFYTSGGTYTYNTSKMYQGNSPVVGGLQSIATFPSMTGDLSGATITSVRAYFYFDFWYYNSGGTAKIGLHGASSLPSTKPTITTVATSSSWPKPGGRWVNIPSTYWAGIKSGTYRGLALGDGSPGLTEYGYARGASTKLEIKYKK